jgi:hypothetical protein
MAQTGAIAERGQAGAMPAARCRVGSDMLDATVRSRFKAARSATTALAANFSAEDQMVQSCPEASPMKGSGLIPHAVHRDSLGRMKGFVHMATYLEIVDLEQLATADARQALNCEVRRGLIARPRSLSPWMFYDAEGSRMLKTTAPRDETAPRNKER